MVLAFEVNKLVPTMIAYLHYPQAQGVLNELLENVVHHHFLSYVVH
jgi:hypothetical protein